MNVRQWGQAALFERHIEGSNFASRVIVAPGCYEFRTGLQ